jgi:mannan endo-1,4-beta-mannosidase
MRRLAALAALMLACVVPASAQARVLFGLSTDTPGEFPAVQRQMHVDLDAPFVGFKAAPDFTYYFTRAKAYGVGTMITWEPWDGRTGKSRGITNRDIARGKADAYLKREARQAKAYRKTLYIRYAHEMNGTWYPWGKDPKAYRQAWVHVVKLFRQVGARNVKWIWSPNLNTYESDATFDRNEKQYWPGKRYVDIVGTTINRQLVQGTFYQSPEWFFTRFDRLIDYGKPMWITESNVDLEDMPKWMPLFQQAMIARPWIRGLVWLDTQAPQNPKFGNVTWKLSEQPLVRQYLAF